MKTNTFDFAIFTYQWEVEIRRLYFCLRPHYFNWIPTDDITLSSEYKYTGVLEFGRN